MEKIKYFMMMALVAMFSMTFTACDEDDETGEKQTADDVILMGQLVGDWFYDELSSDDFAGVFTFNANKTYEYTAYEMKDGFFDNREVSTGTWTIIQGKVVLKVDNGGTERLKLTINAKNDRITLDDGDDKLTFDKIPSEVGVQRVHDMLLLCGGWYDKTHDDMVLYRADNVCAYICNIKKDSNGNPTSADGDVGTWKWEGDSFQEIYKSRTMTYKKFEVSEKKIVETTTDNYKYEYERLSLSDLNAILNVTKDIYEK